MVFKMPHKKMKTSNIQSDHEKYRIFSFVFMLTNIWNYSIQNASQGDKNHKYTINFHIPVYQEGVL